MPTRYYEKSAKVDLWPWDPKSIGLLLSNIHNLHVKFESNLAKTVVCIVPRRFYTQSAKFDLDLRPLWPKINREKFESKLAKIVAYIVPIILHKTKRDRQTRGRSRDGQTAHALTQHTLTAALLYPLQRYCKGIDIKVGKNKISCSLKWHLYMEGRTTHNSNLILLFYFYISISILIFLFYYNCILISILSFQIPVLISLFLLLYFDFNT